MSWMTPRILFFGSERDAEDGAGLPAGHLVDARGEALVLGDVGDDQGLAVLGDPSGDAFADAQADGLEGLAGVSDGNGEVELVMLIIGHEQAPGVRLEVGGDLLHDGLQDGVEVQGRRERLGYVVEDGQLWFRLADFAGRAVASSQLPWYDWRYEYLDYSIIRDV